MNIDVGEVWPGRVRGLESSGFAMDDQRSETSKLLADVRAGTPGAEARLYEALYADLRRMARAQLQREPKGHTLSPSVLINEVYLRLAPAGLSWQNRAHFLATACTAMQRILVDRARAHRAGKRSGTLQRVELDDVPQGFAIEHAEQLLMIDDELRQLKRIRPRLVIVVKLRVFGGLSNKEIADLLKKSVKTINRDWEFARAWLMVRFDGRVR
jgi:RNA polymerase sigma factor (TIGR02999 family)